MKTLYRSILDDDATVLKSSNEIVDSIRAADIVQRVGNGHKVSKSDLDWLVQQKAVFKFDKPQNARLRLETIIRNFTQLLGNNCSLNWIDVSNIIDLSLIFRKAPDFNGDISKWNTSSCKSMSNMFRNIKFNGDIGDWDTSNVQSMSCMFWGSSFNKDISKWNVENVTRASCMFRNSSFCKDISNWNFKKIKSADDIFTGCPLDSPKYEKYRPKGIPNNVD